MSEAYIFIVVGNQEHLLRLCFSETLCLKEVEQEIEKGSRESPVNSQPREASPSFLMLLTSLRNEQGAGKGR